MLSNVPVRLKCDSMFTELEFKEPGKKTLWSERWVFLEIIWDNTWQVTEMYTVYKGTGTSEDEAWRILNVLHQHLHFLPCCRTKKSSFISRENTSLVIQTPTICKPNFKKTKYLDSECFRMAYAMYPFWTHQKLLGNPEMVSVCNLRDCTIMLALKSIKWGNASVFGGVPFPVEKTSFLITLHVSFHMAKLSTSYFCVNDRNGYLGLFWVGVFFFPPFNSSEESNIMEDVEIEDAEVPRLY